MKSIIAIVILLSLSSFESDESFEGVIEYEIYSRGQLISNEIVYVTKSKIRIDKETIYSDTTIYKIEVYDIDRNVKYKKLSNTGEFVEHRYNNFTDIEYVIPKRQNSDSFCGYHCNQYSIICNSHWGIDHTNSVKMQVWEATQLKFRIPEFNDIPSISFLSNNNRIILKSIEFGETAHGKTYSNIRTAVKVDIREIENNIFEVN